MLVVVQYAQRDYESPLLYGCQLVDHYCRSIVHSSLPGCRHAPFAWYAVQTTSKIVTHWPARYPPVTVFYCWRSSFRCGWCSTMEQSATWHRREWHTVTFPLWTQNILIQTVISFYFVLVLYLVLLAAFTARCTLVQSAVLRSHVVCLSVCNVGELWSHRLEFFENNFTIS